MTAPLVTLETAKLQLRITDSEHDADVELRTRQATLTILQYLGPIADPGWTPDTVPEDVQQAILIWVSHLYERGQVTTPDEGGTPSDDDVWRATWRQLQSRKDDGIA